MSSLLSADRMIFDHALRRDVLPALERLAENPAWRDCSLSRFDRDDPPRYASSTEDDEEDDAFHPNPAVDNAALDELNGVLDAPLDDNERANAAWDLQHYARIYDPGARYAAEARVEKKRIGMWAKYEASIETRDFFVQFGDASKLRAGQERINVITRRNIKRRWEKLRVWNSAWGIPDRKHGGSPNDDASKWKWPWHQCEDLPYDQTSSGRKILHPLHPVARAISLRQYARRSEHIPPSPRSRLPDNASTSQAESFLTSRPWFTYKVESTEEFTRTNRLSLKLMRVYGRTPNFVRKQWQDSNEWKEAWSNAEGSQLLGWKWKHESPSPEPEDLLGLEDLTTFELTPSEADALEAIPPPTPSPPRRPYHFSQDHSDVPQFSLFGPPICPPELSEQLESVVKPAAVTRSSQRQIRQGVAPRVFPRRSARIAALVARREQQTYSTRPKRPSAVPKTRSVRSRKTGGPSTGTRQSARSRRARR